MEVGMGKMADNENLKLRATFWNNIAVGFGIAGVLAPCLGLWVRQHELFRWIKAFVHGTAEWNVEETQQILLVLVGAGTAFWIASNLRGHAESELAKLQD
jgi:hypothetical protein